MSQLNDLKRKLDHRDKVLEVCIKERDKARESLEQRDRALEQRDRVLEQRDRALEAEREKRFEAERKALILQSSIRPDCEQARKEREEHFEEQTNLLQCKLDDVQSNLQVAERKSGNMTKTAVAQTKNYWARHRAIDALKKQYQRMKATCAVKKTKPPRGSFLIDVSNLEHQRPPGSAGTLLVDSQVMVDDSRQSTVQKYNIGRGRGSKGFTRGVNSCRNIAGKLHQQARQVRIWVASYKFLPPLTTTNFVRGR